MTAIAKLSGNHLKWVVRRSRRSFAVQVVEPRNYDPAGHGGLFEQLLGSLIMPAVEAVDSHSALAGLSATRFDLLTFPEAFAPVDALLAVLPSIQQIGTIGCIHVGLRPTTDPHHHLFSAPQISALLTRLESLADTVEEDLLSFRSWFARQNAVNYFNLGCLFTIDAKGRLRLCLHPKLVRSKFEYSALAEDHLEEADLVTLVTLLPDDPHFRSVTIQPLICSDALNLPTDRGTPPPIKAVSSSDNPIPEPPDHIDLVSVATCTPQIVRRDKAGEKEVAEWHDAFRQSFRGAAEDGDQFRHHHATFILSNFEMIKSRTGGLSGLFQPIDLPKKHLHPAADLSCFGRKKETGGNNSWWPPGTANAEDWDWRGYIGSLKASTSSDEAAVRIFGFTLSNLLRDASMWSAAPGPGKCEVLLGRWDHEQRLGLTNWEDGYDV